jgi:hypothetical protein
LAHFYADEDFSHVVVAVLRRLGHDVLTIKEAGKAGKGTPDSEVLADATAADRIVLTFNRRHFIRLHKSGIRHRGIVVCTFDDDVEKLAHRIDSLVAQADAAGGWLLRAYRPSR